MSESRKLGFEVLAKESQLYPKEQLAKVKKGKNSFFIGLPKEIALQEKTNNLDT